MSRRRTEPTNPMKTVYTYTIPAETGFRNLTVSADVRDLNPDGFTADNETAREILEELAEANGLVLADEWDTYGSDGDERMLVWASEEDAENDAGERALCQIIRQIIREEAEEKEAE